jgi:hypothetical protein
MSGSQLVCFPVSDAHWEANDGMVTRMARPVGATHETGHVCPAIETIVWRVNGPRMLLGLSGGFNQKPESAISVTFSSSAGNANENGNPTGGSCETVEIIFILSASASPQNGTLSFEPKEMVEEFDNPVLIPSADAHIRYKASAAESCNHLLGGVQMEPMRISASIRMSLKRGQAVLSHTTPTDRFWVMYEGMSDANPFELAEPTDGMTALMQHRRLPKTAFG